MSDSALFTGSDSSTAVGKKVLEFALKLQEKDRRKLGTTAIEYQGNKHESQIYLRDGN